MALMGKSNELYAIALYYALGKLHDLLSIAGDTQDAKLSDNVIGNEVRSRLDSSQVALSLL